MNTAGWLLTENGRQPWIVQGLMLVKDGVSQSVSVTEIWISLIFFIALYGLLAAVDGTLMFRFGRKALGDGDEDEHDDADRRRRTLIRRRAGPGAHLLGDSHGLADRLVHHHRLLLDGVLRPRGVRLRRRRVAHRRREDRPRAPRRDQHDRAVLGWQRGLAHRRRRRHVRCVPRLVRDVVLRALPRARARALRADHPRRLVRVPRPHPDRPMEDGPGAAR